MADHNKTVLVCDNDDKTLASIKTGLVEYDFDVEVMNTPYDLIENAEMHHVGVVIVNPDLPGFNAHDACRYLKNEQGIPVVLLLDPHSTARVSLDGCSADEILTKPVKIDDLANLLLRHIVLSKS